MPDLLPLVAGQTGPTGRAADIYGRLLRERIIFLVGWSESTCSQA
jgi:hypothetical protein